MLHIFFTWGTSAAWAEVTGLNPGQVFEMSSAMTGKKDSVDTWRHQVERTQLTVADFDNTEQSCRGYSPPDQLIDWRVGRISVDNMFFAWLQPTEISDDNTRRPVGS